MKRLSIITFFAFLVLTFAGATSAQVKGKKPKSKPAAPRTVKDFYKILPVKYFSYIEYEPKNRASLMGSHSTANGYLSFDNNRPIQPVNAQILLLKRMSGVSMLVISYTDCDADPCRDSLRFVEYENGRFREADAAPPFDRQKAIEIYRRKTGKSPDDKAYLVYDLSPTDKSISVKFGDAEIYKLEWDGNIYNYAAPNE